MLTSVSWSKGSYGCLRCTFKLGFILFECVIVGNYISEDSFSWISIWSTDGEGSTIGNMLLCHLGIRNCLNGYDYFGFLFSYLIKLESGMRGYLWSFWNMIGFLSC